MKDRIDNGEIFPYNFPFITKYKISKVLKKKFKIYQTEYLIRDSLITNNTNIKLKFGGHYLLSQIK